MKKIDINYNKIIKLTVCFTVAIAFIKFISYNYELKKSIELYSIAYKDGKVYLSEEADSSDYIYLSDIDYVKSMSSVGWKTITMDKTPDNTSLQLKLEGSTTTFTKGVFAHAKSNVVYDLTLYNNTYAYFTTYYGVSAQRGSNGSVKFYIYTSKDGTTWDLESESNPSTMSGNTAAKFIKVDIRNKKYLKLYADAISDNAQDHALYADAKFIKEGYNDNVAMTVSEYDELIKDKYAKNEDDEELEKLILERQLVKNVGQYTLKTFIQSSEANKETYEWLTGNINALRYYIYGGNPTGTWLRSLQVLSNLYNTYKDDLGNNNTTALKTVYSDLYLRMMITLSLTHSANVNLWITGSQTSNAVNRYQIYKELHLEGKLENKIFENLTIEEMRWVMNNQIDDEEIKWLNWYSNEVKKSRGPYQYISYKSGYNYKKADYYSEANKSKWEEKYHLSEYGVSYGTTPKLWMVFEEGAVCGGISKTGSNLLAVSGIPSAVVGQPGHAAYFWYGMKNNGDGYWDLSNDVSGWTATEKGERMLNGWGSTSWDSYYQGSYVVYGQTALNDIDNYNKARKYYLLGNSYTDLQMKEKVYRQALSAMPYHMDAWYELIQVYLKNNAKTESDYYDLASELTNSMYFYPLPMVDLLKLFENKFVSSEYLVKYTLLKTKALTKGTTTKDTDYYQSAKTRVMANYLLGNYDTEIAKFSFNGNEDEAGILKLGAKYTATADGVAWDYSLDGGLNWKQVVGKSIKLTDEELASITAENDIKVHIVGVSYDEANIYTINITKATLPKNLWRNDLENKLINATNTMQWRIKGTNEWTNVGANNHRFTEYESHEDGDYIEVEFRVFANKTCLASDIATYKFWRDNQPKSRTYIPISHLSVYKVSSEATGNNGHAIHAIDGDINTIWHSNYSGGDTNKFIVIKLDEAKYISGLDYIPRQSGTNGRVAHGKMYTSMDGENWTIVSDFNWGNDASTKTITLKESIEAKFVKFQAITNYGDGRNFISAMMINLYEDLDGDRPRANVEYSTTSNTTGTVVATVKVNKKVSIVDTEGNTYKVNNDGDYEFEIDTNKQFKVSFIDEANKTGFVNVSVNWIVDYDFNFNSDSSATISIGKKYETEAGEIEWKYSIDGGQTWIIIENNLVANLSAEQIDNMTEENGLQLAINLIKYNPNVVNEDVFNTNEDGTIGASISVVSGQNIPNKLLYANDLENKIFGVSKDMEWRYVEFDDTGLTLNSDNSYNNVNNANLSFASDWVRFTDEAIQFKGNRKVQVRYAAYANVLPGDEKTYRFTNIEQDENHTYITIDNYKIADYSSENPKKNELVKYAIDGNIYTNWHTDSTTDTDEKYITIELDKPRYLTKVEAIGKENYEFGVIKDGSVYVSMDGINWEKVANCHEEELTREEAKTHNVKVFEFDPVYAKYVKVQNDVSHDYVGVSGANWFFNLAMLNLYENTEQVQDETIVMVEYNVQGLTNQDVIAHVYSPNGTIKIQNNNGMDTYTFTSNGDFEFEYVYQDANGEWVSGTIMASVGLKNDGSANDKVPHIDKKAPVPQFAYSETKNTCNSVSVSLIFDEEIIMLTDDLEFEKDYLGNYLLLFTENGTKTIKVKDLAGNIVEVPVSVNNIDKIAPTATVEYTTNDTNGAVVATIFPSEVVTIENNNGSNSVVFTENGSFTFKYVDIAGNEGSTTATVDWLNNQIEQLNIIYTPDTKTDKEVKATLVLKDGYEVLNNNGSNVYTFHNNGFFEFTYKNIYGAVATARAEVDWIDEEDLVVNVSYDTEKTTSKSVVATVEANKYIKIINNDGKNTYTFTNNGSFVFYYEDEYGNSGSITAIVSWINKEAPYLEVEYDINELTNKDVVATLKLKDGIKIINNDGNNYYTFGNNGTFVFVYEDESKNVGSTVAKVDWIDKEVPTVDVSFSNTNFTNIDVVATINPSEEIVVLNNGGSLTHTFTSNDTFTFKFKDLAGNYGEKEVKVDWISKDIPNLSVSYDTTLQTKGNVVASLDVKDGIIITNNNNQAKYEFTNNGEFTFEYVDKYGNEGTTVAKVDWIVKDLEVSVEYDIKTPTNTDVVATLKSNYPITILNNNGSNIYKFNTNGEFIFKYEDFEGKESSVVANVNWIDKTKPIGTVNYSKLAYTYGSVVATITADEKVKILNNNGNNTYEFKDNGVFVFEIEDLAGNKSQVSAEVNWIIKNSVSNSFTNYSNNTDYLNVEDNVNNDDEVINIEETNTQILKDVLYTDNNVKVTALSSALSEDYLLNAVRFDLLSKYDDIIPGVKDCFKLSLKDLDGNIVDVSKENFLISLPIDTAKNIKALYKLTESNVLEQIDKYVITNDYIEMEISNLESYIILYDELEVVDKEENNINWKAIIGVLTVGTIVCFIIVDCVDNKKPINSNKKNIDVKK